MLLIEIGNTTVKLVRPGHDGAFDVVRLDAPEDVLRMVADESGEIVCAPVGGELSSRLLGQMQRSSDVRVLTASDVASFVGDSYRTPDSLGLDRVLNLLALDHDAIVISCGTAITVDATINGNPRWGAILPGFATAASGLHERVPTLPLVSLAEAVGIPARTSVESVANGVLLGTARAAQSIGEELAPHTATVLTGGDAATMRRLWNGTLPTIDDALLFRGMLRVVSDGRTL